MDTNKIRSESAGNTAGSAGNTSGSAGNTSGSASCHVGQQPFLNDSEIMDRVKNAIDNDTREHSDGDESRATQSPNYNVGLEDSDDSDCDDTDYDSSNHDNSDQSEEMDDSREHDGLRIVPGGKSISFELEFSDDDCSDYDGREHGAGDLYLMIPRAQRDFCFDSEDSDDDFLAPAQKQKQTTTIEPSTLKPTSLFDFEWRPCPEPPLDPSERRLQFKDNNCGPQRSFDSPYSVFTAIWTQEYMEHIASETNKYAQKIATEQIQVGGSLTAQKGSTHWRNTNADELYVYLSLVFMMKFRFKPVKQYWSVTGSYWDTPMFKTYMSFKRFCLLSRYLNFGNIPSPSMPRQESILFRISPLVAHLNKRFEKLYYPGREVAIDEVNHNIAVHSHHQSKVNFVCRQFSRENPASFWIKSYEVCDSQTGYVWRFRVHADCEEVDGEEFTPVSPSLALGLVKGLEYTGRTVFIDNASPVLARVLNSVGLDCAGHITTHCEYLPSELITYPLADKQFLCRTSGDVDITVYRNNGHRKAMVSTYHGYKIKELPSEYYQTQYRLDRKNSKLEAHSFQEKRTKVWYKLFRRLLYTSVFNAHIIFKNMSVSNTQLRRKHRDARRSHTHFGLQIIRSLTSAHV